MTTVQPPDDGDQTAPERDLLDLLAEQSTVAHHPHTEAFLAFHNANPAVYVELVKAARLYRQQTGRERCSIDFLLHRVRWVLTVDVTTDDPFRLNDNHTAYYGRLIAARESDLENMFEMRRSVADDDNWMGVAS